MTAATLYAPQDSTVETGQRVAAMWRRVRWGAALFCVVQFAAYSPSPGVRPPLPLLPVGVVLAALIGLVNIVAGTVERAAPLPSRETGRPATRDLLLLVADTSLVTAVVLLFTFDPGAAVWVLLVVPVLQAGLLGRLPWALGAWALCVAVLGVAAGFAVGVYELAWPGAVLVSSLGFRSGVLLLVALVAGAQASATHRYVRLLSSARHQLVHEATHDHLTGLAGRGLFLERAHHALRTSGSSRAIGAIYIDCDRFKRVNDVHGHAAGDAVLTEVARRLATTVRPSDTVARLGGDEFAVLLDGVTDDEAHEIAARVRAVLGQPYRLSGKQPEIWMTCSVGVAVDDGEVDALPELLRRADREMYRQKAAPRPA